DFLEYWGFTPTLIHHKQRRSCRIPSLPLRIPIRERKREEAGSNPAIQTFSFGADTFRSSPTSEDPESPAGNTILWETRRFEIPRRLSNGSPNNRGAAVKSAHSAFRISPGYRFLLRL